MVASSSGCPPHFVTTHLPYNGKFICDCRNYKVFAICSHSLVAAQVNSAVGEFIEWHLGNFSCVNVTKMTTSGQPKGAGRKGRVAPRKRKTAVRQAATCRVSSMSSAQPQTANSENSEISGECSRPFFVKMMSPYVRICQGCRTNFKCSDNITPDSPLDVILDRVEKREISNSSGAKMLKATMLVSKQCVRILTPKKILLFQWRSRRS